jgi:hypothetical protein
LRRRQNKQASASFLKKRSKKLLQALRGGSLARRGCVHTPMNKSFLVLFFKKEPLLFLRLHHAAPV